MGIYFDHCSHNALVHHNLISHVGEDPIRFNNPGYFALVQYNSAFATGKISTFDHSDRNDLFGMRVTGNIFNGTIDLPAHVVVTGNLITDDPGYTDPENGDFSLRSPLSASDAGALTPGEDGWQTGHTVQPQTVPEWKAADIDWMNTLFNACFELETLTGWQVCGTGKATLTPGNFWGNHVNGSLETHATGTSKRELCLSGAPVAVEQVVTGLYPTTAHTLSGWLRVSDAAETVRLGVRHLDGREEWTESVSSTSWIRVLLDFCTGAEQTGVVVIIARISSGQGQAFADNLGLPRVPLG